MCSLMVKNSHLCLKVLYFLLLVRTTWINDTERVSDSYARSLFLLPWIGISDSILMFISSQMVKIAAVTQTEGQFIIQSADCNSFPGPKCFRSEWMFKWFYMVLHRRLSSIPFFPQTVKDFVCISKMCWLKWSKQKKKSTCHFHCQHTLRAQS